jgi:hypothetical protein
MLREEVQEQSNLRSKRQAAKYLGISIGSLDRQMRGGLPYVKVGKLVRFIPGDLAEFVERRRVAACGGR